MSWYSGIGGAALGLGGGILQNASAREAAQDQMQFQKTMFQHRYQWTMRDMKKAGLNPILAYKQGGGGTPGGSSYTPANVGAAATQGAAAASSSAVALRRNMEEVKNIAADTALKADLSNAAIADANAKNAAAIEAGARTQVVRESLHSAKAAAQKAREDEEFFKSDWGQVVRRIGLIGREINPFVSSARQSAATRSELTVTKYRRGKK